MAKAQRVLTEREIDEQMRLGIKQGLLDYIHDKVPHSKKIENLIDMWKQVNTQLQMMCAERKRQMNFLLMMPKAEREKEIKRLRQKLLPE